MKVVLLRERGSKQVLCAWVVNDDQPLPDFDIEGYYLSIVPTSNEPFSMESAKDEISAWED